MADFKDFGLILQDFERPFRRNQLVLALQFSFKDRISCYTVCVIVICLLYQIMNNTVILKFSVCQISLISPMIKKIRQVPPYHQWRWGGTTFRFYRGDTVLMRGDIRLIGGDPPSPPTREHPAYSFIFFQLMHVTMQSTVTILQGKTPSQKMTGTTRHLQQACPKGLGLITKDIPSHPPSPPKKKQTTSNWMVSSLKKL